MSAGGLWMVAGIALCGLELLLPGVFLLWIGLAALLAGGLIEAIGLDLPGQVVAFLICLVGSLAVPLLRRRGRGRAEGGVNAPASGVVGEHCRALAFNGPEGRVSFRDGTWPARTASGEAPLPGSTLRIVELDGTTLVVVPRENAAERSGGGAPVR